MDQAVRIDQVCRWAISRTAGKVANRYTTGFSCPEPTVFHAFYLGERCWGTPFDPRIDQLLAVKWVPVAVSYDLSSIRPLGIPYLLANIYYIPDPMRSI